MEHCLAVGISIECGGVIDNLSNNISMVSKSEVTALYHLFSAKPTATKTEMIYGMLHLHEVSFYFMIRSLEHRCRSSA